MLAITIFNYHYLYTFRIFLANEINEASTEKNLTNGL